MSQQKSFLSSKDLKLLKKDELISLVLESHNADKPSVIPKGKLSQTPKTKNNTTMTPSKTDQMELMTQIKKAVFEAVSDLKAELRIEYQALLRDVEAKFESEIDALKRENSALKKSFSSKCDELEREFLNDLHEKDMRKDNVMIFGLQESTGSTLSVCKDDDLKAIKLLSSEIGVVDLNIRQCIRLGRRGERPRPLKVTLDSQKRNDLLRQAPRIRRISDHSGFRSVFIKPDLTPKEQAMEKKLREERKIRRSAGELVMIRNGELTNRSLPARDD